MLKRRRVMLIAFIIAAILAAAFIVTGRWDSQSAALPSPENRAKAEACSLFLVVPEAALTYDGKPGLTVRATAQCPEAPEVLKVSAVLEAKYNDRFTDEEWHRQDHMEAWRVKGITSPSALRTNTVTVSESCEDLWFKAEAWRVKVTGSVTFGGDEVPLKGFENWMWPCGQRPQPNPAASTPAGSAEDLAMACRLAAPKPTLMLALTSLVGSTYSGPALALVGEGALRCPSPPESSKLSVRIEASFDLPYKEGKEWFAEDSDTIWLTQAGGAVQDSVAIAAASVNPILLSDKSFKKWRVRVTGSVVYNGKEFQLEELTRTINSGDPASAAS